MDPDHIEPKKQKPFDNYLRYSGLGLQLLGGIGFAAWAGYALDQYLEFSFPVFLLSFVLLAFGGMVYQAYRSFNQGPS